MLTEARPLGVDDGDFLGRGVEEDFTFGRVPDGEGAGVGVVEGVFGKEAQLVCLQVHQIDAAVVGGKGITVDVCYVVRVGGREDHVTTVGRPG